MLVSSNIHSNRPSYLSTSTDDYYSSFQTCHGLPIRDSSSCSTHDSPDRLHDLSYAANSIESTDFAPCPNDYYMQRNQQYNAPNRASQAAGRPVAGPSQHFASTEGGENNGAQQQQSWYQSAHAGSLIAHAAQQRLNRVPTHKRHSSGSTVTSAGPASPYTPASTAFPRVVDAEAQQYPSPNLEPFHDHGSITSYPKSLPTSTSSFTDTFLSPAFQHYHPSHHNVENSVAYQMMRQAVLAQHESEMGGDAMPRNTSGQFDDAYKVTSRDMIPKLDRTMSDVYQDELYNPHIAPSAPAHPPSSSPSVQGEPNKLSPRRDVFSERLQAANNGHMSRSLSPAKTISRDRSPFQLNSLLHTEAYQLSGPPASRLGAGAQLRDRQKIEADSSAYVQHDSSHDLNPQTISPKEAMLGYNEADDDSRVPLFPQEEVKHETQTPDLPSQNSFRSMATTRRESSSNYSVASVNSRITPAPRHGAQVPQQYPFISHPRRQNSNLQSTSDSVPDFPAQLTSMESTKSDTTTRSSQAESEISSSNEEIQRPANTQADSGTYTCTYHGCSLRFETPSKLQKHKCDGHRQATPSGSDSRNSQAGPHKCERLNPTTGKPCNSIFSRPYDLTRHEDTIHNARKQKVRCHLCTEEKTFSRNDALTRHMRVVHPEVDFPGKNKKR